jgi:hypothetical protein
MVGGVVLLYMPSAIDGDLNPALAKGMLERFSPMSTNRNGSKAIVFLVEPRSNGKLAALCP